MNTAILRALSSIYRQQIAAHTARTIARHQRLGVSLLHALRARQHLGRNLPPVLLNCGKASRRAPHRPSPTPHCSPWKYNSVNKVQISWSMRHHLQCCEDFGAEEPLQRARILLPCSLPHHPSLQKCALLARVWRRRRARAGGCFSCRARVFAELGFEGCAWVLSLELSVPSTASSPLPGPMSIASRLLFLASLEPLGQCGVLAPRRTKRGTGFSNRTVPFPVGTSFEQRRTER